MDRTCRSQEDAKGLRGGQQEIQKERSIKEMGKKKRAHKTPVRNKDRVQSVLMSRGKRGRTQEKEGVSCAGVYAASTKVKLEDNGSRELKAM